MKAEAVGKLRQLEVSSGIVRELRQLEDSSGNGKRAEAVRR